MNIRVATGKPPKKENKMLRTIMISGLLALAGWTYPPSWYSNPYTNGQSACPQGGNTSGADTCKKEIPPSAQQK
jgi:hypothetical protein